MLTDTDPTEAPERPRARPRTRYRCRDHEVPVNFRGKGCHECAQALTRKPRKRKAPTPNEVPSWLT